MPGDAVEGATWARFMYAHEYNKGVTGEGRKGEVEDYALGGIVNSTGDKGDSDLLDGRCDTGDVISRPSSGTDSEEEAECTLRAAIEQANAVGAMPTIEFDIPRRWNRRGRVDHRFSGWATSGYRRPDRRFRHRSSPGVRYRHCALSSRDIGQGPARRMRGR